MAFNLIDYLKNKYPKKEESLGMNILFYVGSALLVGAVFCYAIFAFKAYLQEQKINEIDKRINVYASDKQKLAEKELVSYKKRVDDFITIINNHKISSHILTLVEKDTLSNVWFSSFTMSSAEDKITLTGDAENMATLSRQIKTLEEDHGNITGVSILGLQIGEAGKIGFVLDVAFNPNIFMYTTNAPASVASPVNTVANATPDPNLESKSYVNAKEGFTINAPKGWQADESGKFGSVVIFSNPKIDKDVDAFDANINIVVESAQGLGLGDYVASGKQLVNKLFNNYTSTQDQKLTINGMDLEIIGGTYVKGALKLRNLQLIAVKNGKAYKVTATVLDSTFASYKSVVESSLLTFTLP